MWGRSAQCWPLCSKRTDRSTKYGCQSYIAISPNGAKKIHVSWINFLCVPGLNLRILLGVHGFTFFKFLGKIVFTFLNVLGITGISFINIIGALGFILLNYLGAPRFTFLNFLDVHVFTVPTFIGVPGFTLRMYRIFVSYMCVTYFVYYAIAQFL